MLGLSDRRWIVFIFSFLILGFSTINLLNDVNTCWVKLIFIKDEVSIQILTKTGTGSADLCVSIGCCCSHMELVSVKLLHDDQQQVAPFCFPSQTPFYHSSRRGRWGGGSGWTLVVWRADSREVCRPLISPHTNVTIHGHCRNFSTSCRFSPHIF